MPYEPSQIKRVEDYTLSPDPGKDVHWWAVEIPGRTRPGWVWVAGSVPPPSVEWIAGELSRRERETSVNVLEGRLIGPQGMHLDTAPREEN